MSSVLPDAPPPEYDASTAPFRGYGGYGGYFDKVRSGPPRAPYDRGVKRTTECPCAVRLYHLPSNDIAARSEYCSVVLGAPSVGISDALSGRGDRTAALSSSSATAERPIAVQLAWGDTTVWEVAHTALCAVREEVDNAYKAEMRRLARAGRQKTSVGDAKGNNTLLKNVAAAAEEEGFEEDEEEDAPYSSPLHRYDVELLTGSVNALGQASIIPLCKVSCRQVLPGHRSLLPVRKNSSLDYNTALYELAYNLGDPVFVTCTRTV